MCHPRLGRNPVAEPGDASICCSQPSAGLQSTGKGAAANLGLTPQPNPGSSASSPGASLNHKVKGTLGSRRLEGYWELWHCERGDICSLSDLQSQHLILTNSPQRNRIWSWSMALLCHLGSHPPKAFKA